MAHLHHEGERDDQQQLSTKRKKGFGDAEDLQKFMVPLSVKTQSKGTFSGEKPDRPSSGSSNSTTFDDSTMGLSYISSSTDEDTSQMSRDLLNTSRLSLNTHTSLLSISEEDEDEDEDEEEEYNEGSQSFLFEDMADDRLNQSLKNSPPSSKTQETPEISSKHCCVPLASPCSNEVTKRDVSFLDGITERFRDSFCFHRDHDDLVTNVKAAEQTELAWEYHRLKCDFLELLGCANPPDEDEIEAVWAWNHSILFCRQKPDQTDPVSPSTPRRHSPRERALRVHRLRMEQDLPCRVTGLSPAASPTRVLQHRTRSLDDRILSFASYHDVRHVSKLKDDLEKLIGLGLDPIPHEAEDLGYDSDPEGFSSGSEVWLTPPRSAPADDMDNMNPEPQEFARQTVRETLSFTWTLTWHPGKDAPQRNPMTINAWIERGTLVKKNSVMLEPNLMWREAYQPNLADRKLNTSTQKPFSIRLLNLCRILEAPTDLDRSIYPFVRPSCAFILRTSDKQEYLFEAVSEAGRDDVIRRWKLCIARFASLAVMEDLDAIFGEFFTPMVTSETLVPDYEETI